MSLPTTTIRRLMREIGELQKSPPEGVRIQTNEGNMLDVVGIIQGPEGTPYAGGYFKVAFSFTNEFPAAPPKCRLTTKIFHPNVSSTGEICVNTLKKDWKSTYGIAHILVTVKCLLIHPNPESALDEEAGKLVLEDWESFCRRARLITSVHATPKVRPVEFDVPSGVGDQENKDGNGNGKGEVSGSKPPPTSVTATTGTASSTTTPSSIAPPSTTTTATLRKSSSPAPLKPVSSSHSEHQQQQQQRHVSPSPLSTADENVRPPALSSSSSASGLDGALGVEGAKMGGNGTKAVKRAAAGGQVSGAEKRKKALKRL